jgi:hypothetical protein
MTDESRNPLADEDENRPADSGEPEVWRGRYDDDGNVAKGGVAGTALVTDEAMKNPFEDDTEEDNDDEGTGV